MPVAAICPRCGASLSETSVLALAPVCGHCGSVITKSGGTLGLTSAYGVNDPTITRKRVEADLEVFCDYRNKYIGMLEASKEQLNWGVERYAKIPNPPELLEVIYVPNFWKDLFGGLFFGIGLSIAIWIGGGILMIVIALISAIIYAFVNSNLRGDPPWFNFICFVYGILVLGAWIVPLSAALLPHIKAKIANGKRPTENERRQMEYEMLLQQAMKAAEPVKAAQDHRLRCQIRELEGLIKTMSEKAEDVRKILNTL